MNQQATTFANEWDAVFDSISSAIWILDDQHRIQRANKASEVLFNLPISETIGKQCWEIVHKNSKMIPQCPLLKAKKSKKRESVELQIGEKWLEISVDIIADDAKNIIGFVHIVTDISDRKRAQILLSESEEKHRIVSDYAYDWEYWIGLDGKFSYNSPSCERITGYTPAEFENDPELLTHIIYPNDKEKFHGHVHADKQQLGPFSFEFRVIKKGGTIVWLEHICQPVYSKKGEFVGRRACNRDITYRKKIENDLAISEKQLRAILEASTEPVFLIDITGKCLMANTKTANRLSISMEGLLTTNLFNMLPPEIAEKRRNYLLQVSKTGKPIRFEDERLGSTFLNSIYPVVGENGGVERFAIFSLDITEGKRSHQAIEESRRKLSEINDMLNAVINTIPVRIFWKNSNSTYLGCNKHFARDAGKNDPSEVIGDTDYNMAWKDQADLYIQDDQTVMATGTPKINYEEPQTNPDGHQLWLRTTKIPLRDQDNNVVGILGTYEDITQEKENADMLRESEERYRNLFQNNHAPQLIIDPENGRIVDANSAACRFYGFNLEDFIRKSITEIHTLSSAEVHEKLKRAKAEQRSHFLFSHRLANGEIRPVEVFSGPITINKRQFLYSIIHDISERKKTEDEKERLISELQEALLKIKKLSGMLPICCSCKNIRDDQGYWNQIESYIRDHSEAEFSHGICPDCAKKLYPEFFDE